MDQAAVEAADGADVADRPDVGPSVSGDIAAVLGGYLLLGLVSAVLWWLLVDPAMFTRTRDGGVSMGEIELTQQFNADGWYAVIAAVLGILSGAALTWWRSRDHLLTTGLLVVGSGLAAALTAGLGGLLGPGDPRLVAAEVGDRLPAALEVSSPACYLVWPIAALVGALVVLWSPPASVPDA